MKHFHSAPFNIFYSTVNNFRKNLITFTYTEYAVVLSIFCKYSLVTLPLDMQQIVSSWKDIELSLFGNNRHYHKKNKLVQRLQRITRTRRLFCVIAPRLLNNHYHYLHSTWSVTYKWEQAARWLIPSVQYEFHVII